MCANGVLFLRAPKIQRRVPPQPRQHRRQVRAEKRRRYENTRALATTYNDLIASKHKAEREAKHDKHVAKKRSESRKESAKEEKPAKAAAAPAKAAAAPAKAAAAAPKAAAP